MKIALTIGQYTRELARGYNPQSGERGKNQKFPVPLQPRAELGLIVDTPQTKPQGNTTATRCSYEDKDKTGEFYDSHLYHWLHTALGRAYQEMRT